MRTVAWGTFTAAAGRTSRPVPHQAPTPAPAEPIRVYPRAWQREWLQRYLAAQMAQSAQTIKPTADDLAIASMRHAEAQRAADDEYERKTGKAAVERRWVKRD